MAVSSKEPFVSLNNISKLFHQHLIRINTNDFPMLGLGDSMIVFI